MKLKEKLLEKDSACRVEALKSEEATRKLIEEELEESLEKNAELERKNQ